jgi:hypothetical protein
VTLKQHDADWQGNIQVSDVMPGDEPGYAAIVVSHELRSSADVSVRIKDLVDEEVDCFEPERDGQPDCEPGGTGQLSEQMLLAVYQGGLQDGHCYLAPGVEPLEGFTAVSPTVLEGEDWSAIRLKPEQRACLILSWWLPDRSDNNRVMGDVLKFSLEVSAEGTNGQDDTAVGGVKIEAPKGALPPPTSGAPTVVRGKKFEALPRTGAPIYVPMAVGAGLVVLGLAARRLARQNRQEEA